MWCFIKKSVLFSLQLKHTFFSLRQPWHAYTQQKSLMCNSCFIMHDIKKTWMQQWSRLRQLIFLLLHQGHSKVKQALPPCEYLPVKNVMTTSIVITSSVLCSCCDVCWGSSSLSHRCFGTISTHVSKVPCAILSFLITTLRKVKGGELGFNNTFYLAQYIQNIISTCNQYEN